MAIDSDAPPTATAAASDTGKTSIAKDSNTPTESEDQEVKYAAPGTLCGVHNVYQTKPDENDETSWSKELPETLVDPAEDAESAQYTLIVRNVKCYDGRKSLSIHSIVIQSEFLKTFLGQVLEGYPGITVTLERLEFTAPFKPLVHRWENFLKAREEEELDETTKEHVDLLHKILEEELRDILARKKDLIRNGVITHSLLWTLFEPGDVVIATVGGRRNAYLFTDDAINCRTKAIILEVKYVEFDGNGFGYNDDRFEIPAFIGTTPVTSLPAFPLRYHPDKETIREGLITRGKVWEQHKGYHYKQYEGTATGFLDDDKTRKFHVKSRIIIDTEAFNVFHPHKSIWVWGVLPDQLTDEHWLVASSSVWGYSLRDKEWLRFHLDSTSEIEWNSAAFDSLVLPKEQENLKDLILAFAKSHSMSSFDDVVQGKGRGIIMQLSGPPGVGKTMTAESVAEVMQVPLYAMSAGDLGSDAYKVESNLKDILRMIPKWGAVLLLDEADVFMEARTSADLQRNELVSIFLRMLEYYEGILFLTTNRADQIDPAFESRIHVSLSYQNLDFTSRRHVWCQFLARSANTEVFSEEELDCLAAVELNGRQIKNMLKTAGLLAWSQKKDLNFEHVQTVLSLRESAKPALT